MVQMGELHSDVVPLIDEHTRDLSTKISNAKDLIARILEAPNGEPCVTCSFQTGGMVVLHMLLEKQPDMPVLFLDTGYHFAETYEYRDQMTRQWNLNLVELKPELSVEAQE